ncbi:MAG: LptF/LptG family permease [Endomicrobia bacterium]|nr:LptF/LptG family permease [Endomicrobiia bacterium]MCX7940871.1 LptF/LptG family permease [Endomicrobiia bacterium]MDW8055554.1 LptF/LptG family permease [Elusimicrobiota bacterium]
MKVIEKYIFKNFIANLFIYLSILSILLLLNYVYQLIYSIVAHKTPLLYSIKLFTYLFPSVLSLTIPITILLSILITLSTMNETKELLVVETLGINRLFFFLKLFLLILILSLGLIYFNNNVVPKSYKEFRTTYSELVTSRPSVNFSDNQTLIIQNKKIIVKKTQDLGNKMLIKNIMIYTPVEEHNSIQTIFAENAYVYNDSDDNLILDLYNGTSITASKSDYSSVTFLKFGNYKYIIYNDYMKKLISKTYSLRELTTQQLISEFIKETNNKRKTYILSEFTLRYSISLSLLSFSLLGTVLGLKIKRGAKPLSFASTIGIVTIYYFLLTTSMSFIENYSLVIDFSIAHIIMQLPNILLVMIAFLLHLFSK